MRKILGVLVVMLSLALHVSGCSGGPGIERTVWILESFADESVQVRSYGMTMPSATLADGEVYGVLGVNSFRGSYQLSGKDISFSLLTSTEKAGDPAALEQEALFLSALQAAAHITVQDRTLVISDSADLVIIRFSEALEG